MLIPDEQLIRKHFISDHLVSCSVGFDSSATLEGACLGVGLGVKV